jgi:diguanylate cyclase (GGDEF)-like protein
VPQWLITREAFFARTHEAQIGIGLYYGILLALLLFNLTIYLSLREPAYGWYVLYVASFGLVQLNLNGLAFEYLWPNAPNFANLALPLSMAFGLAMMALFARSFLDVKARRPRVNRLFEGFIGFQLLMMAASAILPYRPAILVETASVFLIIPLILMAALSLIRSGFRPASYFLLAWAALLIGTVTYALVSFGMLPKLFLTEYGIQIGSALEMTLLSFALAFRIRDLEQDKQRLIRQSRDELEERVERRTLQLNQALAELGAVNRQLHEVSRRDGLTGVYNRRFLEQTLDSLWTRSMDAGESFAVLMFDLDHFKTINDRYGHLVGDDCLRTVAEVLRAHLRGPCEYLARWGGEEFILLLPDTSLNDACIRAEQIRIALESRPAPNKGAAIELRVSIGVAAAVPTRDSLVNRLIESADRALYRAKAAGRNRVAVA